MALVMANAAKKLKLDSVFNMNPAASNPSLLTASSNPNGGSGGPSAASDNNIINSNAHNALSISLSNPIPSLNLSTDSIPPEGLEPSGSGEFNPNGTCFTCQHCQKIFWSESSLKHHQSLYHSEKAFVCEICGKAFRFRSNLAEHRSVHTSIKPYVCKFCGKSSRLKGNLTKHILKHHKKEQNAYIGKDDIIIKKGKKSIKDPIAVDFLEKSMIVLPEGQANNFNLTPINKRDLIQNGRSCCGSTSSSCNHSNNNNNNNNNHKAAGGNNAAAAASAAMQLFNMAQLATSTGNNHQNNHNNNSPLVSYSDDDDEGGEERLEVDTGGEDDSISNSPPPPPPNMECTANTTTTISNNLLFTKNSLNLTSASSAMAHHRSLAATAADNEEDDDDNDDEASSPTHSATTTPRKRPSNDDDFNGGCGGGGGTGQTGGLNDSYSPASQVTDPIRPMSSSNQCTSGPSISNPSAQQQQQQQNSATRCPECGKHFRKATAMSVHMTLKHGHPPPTGAANNNNNINNNNDNGNSKHDNEHEADNPNENNNDSNNQSNCVSGGGGLLNTLFLTSSKPGAPGATLQFNTNSKTDCTGSSIINNNNNNNSMANGHLKLEPRGSLPAKMDTISSTSLTLGGDTTNVIGSTGGLLPMNFLCPPNSLPSLISAVTSMQQQQQAALSGGGVNNPIVQQHPTTLFTTMAAGGGGKSLAGFVPSAGSCLSLTNTNSNTSSNSNILTPVNSLGGPSASINNSNNPAQPTLLSSDLKELKAVLNQLRSESGAAAGAGGGSGSFDEGKNKLESLLLSLDSRVGHLEKQVESSIGSLYSLVQLQTNMNAAFGRFKEDVSGQLKNLNQLMILQSSSAGTIGGGGGPHSK